MSKEYSIALAQKLSTDLINTLFEVGKITNWDKFLSDMAIRLHLLKEKLTALEKEHEDMVSYTTTKGAN